MREAIAATADTSGCSRVISLGYNSEFERGHVVEQFSFRVEDRGLELHVYEYVPRRKLKCYMIGPCDLVDVSLSSARR